MPAGRASKLAVTAVAFLCAVGLARTAYRAAEWGDTERFYLNEIAHGGETAMVYNNLAMHYAEKGDAEKAKAMYRTAAAKMPRPEPLYNLSTMLINEGRYAEAREALVEALRRDPQFGFARERLAQLDAFLVGRRRGT